MEFGYWGPSTAWCAGGVRAVAVLVNMAASSGCTGGPHTCSLHPGQGFVLQN